MELEPLRIDYVTATESISMECDHNCAEFQEDFNHIDILISNNAGMFPDTGKNDRVKQDESLSLPEFLKFEKMQWLNNGV